MDMELEGGVVTSVHVVMLHVRQHEGATVRLSENEHLHVRAGDRAVQHRSCTLVVC